MMVKSHCFPGGVMVKNPPVNAVGAGDVTFDLCQEDPEQEKAIYYGILAWRIPGP